MVKSIVLLAAVVAALHSTTAHIVLRKEYEPEYDQPLQSDEVTEDENSLRVPELYWKPYTGAPVPEDAILAGKSFSVSGDNVGVYVGQADIDVISGAKTQVVAIHDNSPYVISTYTRNVATKNNVRILCSNATNLDDIITWIPWDKADKFDPDEDFVITGRELSKVTWSDTNLFTGRSKFNGQSVVGKVVMGSTSFRFYFAYDEGERLKKEDFEILAYTEALSKLKE